MRAIVAMALLILVAGCGVDKTFDTIIRTAPGTPLPQGISFAPCLAMDAAGRCTQYKNPSDQCVNPKGYEATPPIVPCSSIKK